MRKKVEVVGNQDKIHTDNRGILKEVLQEIEEDDDESIHSSLENYKNHVVARILKRVSQEIDGTKGNAADLIIRLIKEIEHESYLYTGKGEIFTKCIIAYIKTISPENCTVDSLIQLMQEEKFDEDCAIAYIEKMSPENCTLGSLEKLMSEKEFDKDYIITYIEKMSPENCTLDLSELILLLKKFDKKSYLYYIVETYIEKMPSENCTADLLRRSLESRERLSKDCIMAYIKKMPPEECTADSLIQLMQDHMFSEDCIMAYIKKMPPEECTADSLMQLITSKTKFERYCIMTYIEKMPPEEYTIDLLEYLILHSEITTNSNSVIYFVKKMPNVSEKKIRKMLEKSVEEEEYKDEIFRELGFKRPFSLRKLFSKNKK